MLSGEGNARERRKNNNRSNQQKSNFARAAHFSCTFLCRCFARPQRETSRNFFMDEMSNVFQFTASFSLFLCLSLALYSKFVDMTINLSLILQKTRIQKQFLLFGFVFIDSLVVSALQTRVAMRFPAKITSSCIWVTIPVD